MSTERTVADVLDGAAAVIRRNGWHQGAFSAFSSGRKLAERPVCAMGAINIVTCGRPDQSGYGEEHTLSSAAYSALERHLGIDHSAGAWNDNPDRTVEEVLAALEGAARAERERGAS